MKKIKLVSYLTNKKFGGNVAILYVYIITEL